MSCTTTDMRVNRRDDVSFELTFKDVDGQAIDLTGSLVFFTVKKRVNDPDDDALIEKTISTFQDPTSGIATLVLTSTDTDLSAGKYFYDVQLKTVDNKIASSGIGNFFVDQDITVRTS